MNRWIVYLRVGWLGSLIATVTLAAEAGRGDGGFNQFNLSNSIVPVVEIIETGLDRDSIPSIDHPRFLNGEQVGYLQDDDLVLSVAADGQARAFPLKILARHEVVNDVIGPHAIAVT